MKTVLNQGIVVFNPLSQTLDFSAVSGFDASRVYAVINITQNQQIIYAVASYAQGFGGTWAGSTVTLTYDTTTHNAGDDLQIIYDDQNFTQPVSGTVSVTQPVSVEGTTGAVLAVPAAIHDGSGTFPILSSVDPISGKDGLDINLLSSSYGGKLNNPLPLPFSDQALSVAFNNGGNLSSPAMDLATNQLIVDATQSGNVPVDIVSSSGTISVSLDAVTTAQTIPVSTADAYVTGFGPQTTVGNNVLEASATANSTDVSGYRSATVAIVSASTSGTYIFEQSADNVNFRPLAVFNAETANPNAIISAVTATATTIIFHFPIKARYIRCRIATVLNNTGIRAFSRYSQETWAPTAVQAINATAANLNTNVSGSLTTVTTVTGVTTVSTVTQSNSAIPVQVADVTNLAISATATAGPFTPTNGTATSVLIVVSIASGTNPTMDVSIEMSDDGGTSWFKVYDFPRITGVGTYRSAPLKLLGNRVRYVQTIGGTGASFTRTITRSQRSDTIFSRFVARDRTINPNTLNSTSAALYCEGTSGFNFYIRITAQTTPATIQIQFSDDNTNWYDDVGTTITTAVGIVQVKADNDQWRFARAIVSAAGTGITMDEFVIKALRE